MEKLSRFSYLLNPQPWCAAVGSCQIPQRSEMSGWALLCPSGSTYCPTHRHSRREQCSTSFAIGSIDLQRLSSHARHSKKKCGRSARLHFLIWGPFGTLVLEMLTRNFDFQQCLKKSVTQVKWETCLFLSKWSSLINLYSAED